MKSCGVCRDGNISTRSTTLAKDETASEQSSNREKRKIAKEVATRVSGLVRVLPRVWGLYRRIGRWRGAIWSKEQGKANGFEFGMF